MRQHTIATPYAVGDVHFYTTDLQGESVLFDTGPSTPEALHYLRSQVNLKKLGYIFITHCHADHYGLVEYLSHHTFATIVLPRRDVLKFQHHEARLVALQKLMREQGFDERQVGLLREMLESTTATPKLPTRFEIAEESRVPASLGIEILPCPGHSQSDLVYIVGNEAVSGDVLLQNLFQVPLLDADLETFSGRFRNYEAYCRTLRALPRLAGLQINPGHRGAVDSVEETVVWYVRKMLERARRLRTLSAEGHADFMSVLQRICGEEFKDLFVVYLKASEIVFLRDFLEEPESLRGALQEVGIYARVREPFEAVAG